MHPNAKLIETFYTAFKNKDVDTLASLYHPDVHFTDPAFGDLRGKMPAAMWRMLLSNNESNLEVTFRDIQADDTRGSAHWDARYIFTATGRPVLNRIDASFEFKDGKIIRHIDRFDMHRWSRQALGLSGLLLGWTPIVRNKVQKNARGRLDAYVAKHGLK